MRRFIIILLFGSTLLLSWYLYRVLEDDFSIANITFDIPERPEWRIPPLSVSEQESLKSILNQPFTYLDKGHQCYAFVSADDRYVLKFIKFTYLKPSSFLELLPNWSFINSYRRSRAKGQQNRIERVYTGFRIAYELDKENTGLLFIHLMPTNDLKQNVTLIDRRGSSVDIDLDHFAFVVQKKATMTRQVMKELLEKKDLNTAKLRFGQILDMYRDEYRKGLYDSDHNLMYNTGFADEKPMRLDVGRLKYDPTIPTTDFGKKDLQKIVDERIDRWLNKYYPQYAHELMDALHERG